VQLSSVILARVLGFVETFDLSPRGKLFLPEIIPEIVKRYGFLKFPKTLEDFDESKGVEFLEGKFEGKVIQKFVIWNTLLVLETRSNTADSKQILEGMLEWGADEFGLTYGPGTIKRFGYVSDVTFHSDAPLLGANSAVTNLASGVGAAVSAIWGDPVEYHPLVVTVGHDPLSRKNAIANFTIQRRSETRFTDNKYFSEAPLPTDEHLTFLEEYEKDVLRTAHK
jgi:hypothetical protein